MEFNSITQQPGQASTLSAFAAGRTVGILLLLQLVAALTLPFILAKPITAGSPAFLTAGAAHDLQIRGSVMLSFVGSALTLYLGITFFKALKNYSNSMALLFALVCAISCTLDLVHASTIMSMLSISNSFVAGGATNTTMYELVATVVASARRSAHIIQLLGIAGWMLAFYITSFRFKLIPPVLALIGLVGVLSQFIGVTLMMLLGKPAIGTMAMPLLPIQIIVGVWLIAKGFRVERRQQVNTGNA